MVSALELSPASTANRFRRACLAFAALAAVTLAAPVAHAQWPAGAAVPEPTRSGSPYFVVLGSGDATIEEEASRFITFHVLGWSERETR